MASASTPLILTDATLGNNPFTPARPSFGIDVAGRVKWFFVQSGVVNGEDVEGQAAVGNHKDVYATVEFALPDGISGLGLYYHSGGYDLDDPTAGTLFDRYDREGVFANVTRDKFRIAGAYIKGTDHVDTRADQKIDGYYIQTDVHPVDWVVPFIRYDDVKTTDDVAETRTRKGTLGTAFRLFENEITAGRIVLEVSRTKDQDVSSNGALAALLWAF
jgi:hypothetical protein